MVIKSISRKSNVGQLIRYVFRADAERQPAKSTKEKPFYIPGIKFTKQDLHHLIAEKQDAEFLIALEKSGLSDIEFIEKYLIRQDTVLLAKNHLRTQSIDGHIREFENSQVLRVHTHSRQVAAYHEILSWSPRDAAKMTPAMLQDIAKEYLKIRTPNGLAVAVLHKEKDHLHIHFCISGTLLSGKANRITKSDFSIVKNKIQEYQKEKYPELISLPRHGKSKSKEIDKEAPEKNINATKRFSEKQSLQKCLDEAYKTSVSKQVFLEQLQNMGHEPYYRNGRFQGVKFEGERKYRINRMGYTDEKLLALDLKKAKEEKELEQLKELREHISNERSKLHSRSELINDDTSPRVETNTQEINAEQNGEQATLQELADIRDNSNRDMDLDDSPDDNTDSQDDSEDEQDEDEDMEEDEPKNNSDTDDTDDSDDTE